MPFNKKVALLRFIIEEGGILKPLKIWNKNSFTVGEQEVFYYESTDGPKFVSSIAFTYRETIISEG